MERCGGGEKGGLAGPKTLLHSHPFCLRGEGTVALSLPPPSTVTHADSRHSLSLPPAFFEYMKATKPRAGQQSPEGRRFLPFSPSPRGAPLWQRKLRGREREREKAQVVPQRVGRWWWGLESREIALPGVDLLPSPCTERRGGGGGGGAGQAGRQAGRGE